MWRNRIFSVTAILLTSCAANRSIHMAITERLPTTAEVHSYVQGHWRGWDWRFSSLAGRRGEAASLVSLGAVSCSYVHVTPQCDVQVTGQFASGERRTLPMYSQFGRDPSGNLVEVF